jgi:hypothetical protein
MLFSPKIAHQENSNTKINDLICVKENHLLNVKSVLFNVTKNCSISKERVLELCDLKQNCSLLKTDRFLLNEDCEDISKDMIKIGFECSS